MRNVSAIEQFLMVKYWNELFPPGTIVRVFDLPNDWTRPHVDTITVSKAELIEGEAVVLVRGANSADRVPVLLDCLLVLLSERKAA